LAKISPHCAICPSCSEVVVDVPVEQTHIVCPYCQKDWCRRCMATPYHEGSGCSRESLLLTIYQSPGGEDIRTGVEKGEIKLCPGCHTLTTKNGGCNHITCRQCDVHWCWLCGDQIPADNPQSHFNSDYGVPSCRGRLFE
jgi:E3 ubiquitin-protein ligase RNF14